LIRRDGIDEWLNFPFPSGLRIEVERKAAGCDRYTDDIAARERIAGEKSPCGRRLRGLTFPFECPILPHVTRRTRSQSIILKMKDGDLFSRTAARSNPPERRIHLFMTLKLHKITDDIERLRQNARARAAAVAAALPEARSAFEKAAAQTDLVERARRAAAQGWDGAMPLAGEGLSLRKPAPPQTENLTLVAVDGSQVYPDKHAAAFFYALNIGRFILRFGIGQSEADSEPTIVFDDESLYPDGNAVTNVIVNARRTVEEMSSAQELTDRERAAAPERPLIALIDGGLALRIDEKSFPAEERDRLQSRFFAALDALARDEIPPAGYISRPGGAPVLALLDLALGKTDASSANPRLTAKPFGGLADSALFEQILSPGERSALFEFASFWNNLYRDRALHRGSVSHSVHFFYLNVGKTYPVVARVEIPQWVAEKPALVDRIHAALVEQSAVTLNDPYPYALIRADEEAFISSQEKAYLDGQMAVALIRDGLRVSRSEKLSHKGRARKR
jgi:hypothetical protein